MTATSPPPRVARWQLMRPLPAIERNLLAWYRTWWVLLSGVFEPIFYLLGMGLGQRLRRRLPEERFRQLFLTAVILLGLYLVLRQLF